MSANLFEVVRRACSTPERTLIEAEGRPFTGRDMLELTGRLANILVLSGVEPDDRVVVQAEPTPEHVLLFLAVLRAGAVYVAVDRLAKFGDIVAEAAPRLVVCHPSMREMLAPLAEKHAVAEVQTLDAQGGGMLMTAAAKAPTEFADVPREERDLAAIFYVGDDGRAARFTHGDLATRAKPLIEAGQLTALLSLVRS
jgi:malonyl-CoA/methylmalonyl-CoA synthetase